MISTPCAFKKPPYGLLKPSTSVLKDAEKFSNEHLGGFRKYVSISARFEKVSMEYWKLSLKELRQYLEQILWCTVKSKIISMVIGPKM